MSFEAGAVVRLKSGGPWMTIERVEEQRAECAWFIGSMLVHGTFHVAALTAEARHESS